MYKELFEKELRIKLNDSVYFYTPAFSYNFELRNYPDLKATENLPEGSLVKIPFKATDNPRNAEQQRAVFILSLIAYRGGTVPHGKLIESTNVSAKRFITDRRYELNLEFLGKKLIPNDSTQNELIHADEKHGKEGGYYIDYQFPCDINGNRIDRSKLRASEFLVNSGNPFVFSSYPNQLKMEGFSTYSHQLEDMIQGSPRKRVISITGGYGIGKSKLAFETCRAFEDKGWNTIWLDRMTSNINNFADSLNRASGDTLIFIDDVQFCLDIFRQVMPFIITSKLPKIRLIITSDEDQQWDSDYIAYNVDFSSIPLRVISDSDLSTIVSNYISFRGCNDVIDKRVAFAAIIEKLNELNISDARPLYSLFLVEAICNGNSLDNWENDDILRFLINSENRKIASVIQSMSINEEYNFYLNIIKVIRATANITGTLDMDSFFSSDLFNIDKRQHNTILSILDKLSIIKDQKIVDLAPLCVHQAYCLDVLLDDRVLSSNQFNKVIAFVLEQDYLWPIFFFRSIIDDIAGSLTPAAGYFDSFNKYPNNDRLHALACIVAEDFHLFRTYYKSIDSNSLEEGDDTLLETIKKQNTTRLLQMEAVKHNDLLTHGLRTVEPLGPIASYKGNSIWGRPFGHGVATWSSGVTCEGFFFHGHIIGIGTFEHPDGRTYTCNFELDPMSLDELLYSEQGGKRVGLGTCIWNDGATYIGEWRAGCRYGSGKMVYPNKTELEGEWVLDEYIGPNTVPQDIDDSQYCLY